MVHSSSPVELTKFVYLRKANIGSNKVISNYKTLLYNFSNFKIQVLSNQKYFMFNLKYDFEHQENILLVYVIELPHLFGLHNEGL